jgi:phenylalanyl-tRNA synthetase alpha chain
MSSTTDLERLVLLSIDKEGSIPNSRVFAEKHGLDHEKLVGTLNSLKLGVNMIDTENKSEKVIKLTKEGEKIYKDGASPEVLLFKALPPRGEKMNKNKLKEIVGEEVEKIGFGRAKQNKWIDQETDKTDAKNVIVYVFRTVDDVEDTVLKLVTKLAKSEQLDAEEFKQLKLKKLASEETIKYFSVTKGEFFATERRVLQTDLTSEMLASGSWKDVSQFKPYNFAARGKRNDWNGYLHPLLKVRSEFRKIFFEMGFEEMETNKYCESSFWNFDALFQPQQHPARDAHDTFFLANPKTALQLPDDGYLEKVKQVHSVGAHGSLGYRYEWKIEEAQKNLLRTHTTAVSARVLRNLAKEIQETGKFIPRKFFSIDKVFRNEVPDQTHLCEFHQIEGMVIDRGLSLGDMIGLFSTFFSRIGITQLKFKPAYNPYTEPSMEIFGYHPQLQRWVEIGNSGMFRPEMLLPLGLPEDVTVLAWGLSLERPTMIKYSIDNIRELVGHKTDIEMTRTFPLTRLDIDDGKVLRAYREKKKEEKEKQKHAKK